MYLHRHSLIVPLLFLLIASAHAADPRMILPGQAVFIGEEGLDISGIASSGTIISWYDYRSTPGVSAPDATVTISNACSMYISSATFQGRTGYWYIGNTSVPAFLLTDPSLDVKIWDQDAQRDVTGYAAGGGDTLNFRIESNLFTIRARPDFAGSTPDIRIKVKTSDGTVYTGLYNTTTSLTSLRNLRVDTLPFYWVPVNNPAFGWKTDVLDPFGNRMYPYGTYTVWAESNVNRMKDNYKDPSGSDYTGKTVSSVKTVTIAADTVHIESYWDSVVRGHPFSVTISGRPDTDYYLWVRETGAMSGLPGDQPPLIATSQDGVLLDPAAGPFLIGAYQFDGGNGKTIRLDVPASPANGTRYYAKVRLSRSGLRTVGFTTSRDTKADRTYTLHVERSVPPADSGSNRTFKSDEVDVTIQKGAVQIVAAGDQQRLFRRADHARRH